MSSSSSTQRIRALLFAGVLITTSACFRIEPPGALPTNNSDTNNALTNNGSVSTNAATTIDPNNIASTNNTNTTTNTNNTNNTNNTTNTTNTNNVGCESYSFGQCPAGQGCRPITALDGICEDVGTVAPHGACTNSSDCGEGTECIQFQTVGVIASVPVGRCLPFCNAAANSQAAADATCPSGTLDGHCLDVSDDQPGPDTGFCLEVCPSSDSFGTGSCSGPSNYCGMFTGVIACLPGGSNTIDEACDPADLSDQCDGISYCERDGNGGGTCRAYCQPLVQSNSLLGCSAPRSCDAISGNLGLCRDACTPTDFADTACPTGLQNCIPTEPAGTTYCSASGSTGLGGSCAPFGDECAAGDGCMNPYSRGDLSADPSADGLCTNLCDPFGTAAECAANEVCMASLLERNTEAGNCTTVDENVAVGATCLNQGSVCGPSSVCLEAGGAVSCFELCDLDDPFPDCNVGSCLQLFTNPEVRIGFCG